MAGQFGYYGASPILEQKEITDDERVRLVARLKEGLQLGGMRANLKSITPSWLLTFWPSTHTQMTSSTIEYVAKFGSKKRTDLVLELDLSTEKAVVRSVQPRGPEIIYEVPISLDESVIKECLRAQAVSSPSYR